MTEPVEQKIKTNTEMRETDASIISIVKSWIPAHAYYKRDNLLDIQATWTWTTAEGLWELRVSTIKIRVEFITKWGNITISHRKDLEMLHFIMVIMRAVSGDLHLPAETTTDSTQEFERPKIDGSVGRD